LSQLKALVTEVLLSTLQNKVKSAVAYTTFRGIQLQLNVKAHEQQPHLHRFFAPTT